MKTTFYTSIQITAVAAVLIAGCVGCSSSNQHSAYRSIHGDARDGNATLVAKDIKQSPDQINLPDDAGLTPLHLAASACHTNVVTLLLSQGAKIDSRAKDGATPLHLAAQEGCGDVVNLLLTNGAPINPRDNQGRTPLKRAEEWHQESMVQLLRQHGGTE